METPTQPAANPTVTTPSERVWEIDCYIATEQGLLPDPGEVSRAMVECGAILQRIGGVMSMGTVREEFPVHSGRLVTTKILVRWKSFSPRMHGVAVAPEPDPPAPAPEVGQAITEGEAAAANGNGATVG